MLARGDQTPVARSISYTSRMSIAKSHTSPESMQALGLICVAHAVAEGIELVACRESAVLVGIYDVHVRLKACLYRIERIL